MGRSVYPAKLVKSDPNNCKGYGVVIPAQYA